ncbi:MAG: methyltransferase domain-containing protein, partial [Myxococcota bacterium]
DNADSMLARAHTRTREGLRFEAGDLASYGRAASFDLVFSNAALHWVPDHPLLLARLSSLVRDGGQLAVQVPDNFDQPSHTAANAAAAEEPFRTALGAYTKPVHVLPPERYAVALHALGFDSITVRMQVYLHLLPNRDDVVEWVKGTTLTAFQERMPEGVFMAFLERYRALLFEQLPDERPFPFTFKRILMWGRKRRAE